MAGRVCSGQHNLTIDVGISKSAGSGKPFDGTGSACSLKIIFDCQLALKLNVFKQVSIATPLGGRMHGVARSHLLFVFKKTQILGGVETGDMGITTPQSIEDATLSLYEVHAPNLSDEEFPFQRSTDGFDSVSDINSFRRSLLATCWVSSET